MGEPSISAKTVASYLEDVYKKADLLQGEDNYRIRAYELERLIEGPVKGALAEAEEAADAERAPLKAECLACAAVVCAAIADCFGQFAMVDKECKKKLHEALGRMARYSLDVIALDPRRVSEWLTVESALRGLGDHANADAALAEALRSGVSDVVVDAKKRMRSLGKDAGAIGALVFDRGAALARLGGGQVGGAERKRLVVAQRCCCSP